MMSRLPLPVVLPLLSAIAVGIIGISIGLSFLELDSQFGHTVPLFVASGYTVLIMAVAAWLHMRVTKREQAQVDPGAPMMGGKMERGGDPTDKGPTDPTRPTP